MHAAAPLPAQAACQAAAASAAVARALVLVHVAQVAAVTEAPQVVVVGAASIAPMRGGRGVPPSHMMVMVGVVVLVVAAAGAQVINAERVCQLIHQAPQPAGWGPDPPLGRRLGQARKARAARLRRRQGGGGVSSALGLLTRPWWRSCPESACLPACCGGGGGCHAYLLISCGGAAACGAHDGGGWMQPARLVSCVTAWLQGEGPQGVAMKCQGLIRCRSSRWVGHKNGGGWGVVRPLSGKFSLSL